MAEIERVNFFTYQFLVEDDFDDEQAYHLGMRRRHNRVLHSWGVAEGLEVDPLGDAQVSISPGTAIDKYGREIVLPSDPAPEPIDLSGFAPLAKVNLAIVYQEVFLDEHHYTAGGLDEWTRTTERPALEASMSDPPGDGSVILLAQVSLDELGHVGGIDTSVRTLAGAVLPSGDVEEFQLADGAVTSAKIAGVAAGDTDQDITTGTGVKRGHIQDHAITQDKLEPGVQARLVTNGDAHAHTDAGDGAKINHSDVNQDDGTNPHGTTAADVGAVVLADVEGKLVTNGDTHDHLGGDGAQINHSSLSPDDGTNPHGTTAADVGAVVLADVEGKLVTNGDNHDHSGGDGAQIKHSSLKLDGGKNPHKTTAVDVEALAIEGGWVSGDVEFQQTVTIGSVDIFRTQVAAGWTVPPYLVVNGHAYIEGVVTAGTKALYVVDPFINGSGQTLRTGDVVRLKGTPIARFRGVDNKIPVAEVALTDEAADPAVIGIVDREAIPGPDDADTRTTPEDSTSIPDGEELYVVTLGAYAHCKADATEAPIEAGDLLTTSSKPGHAKKATDPKIGTIIGKALEPLAAGTGYIAVFVNMQ